MKQVQRLRVGVPLYEPDERLLHRCLGSIASISPRRDIATEVVIGYDSAPSPVTSEIVNRFVAESSSRFSIEVLPFESRLGMSRNWNRVLQYGGLAEMLLLVGQDDTIEPNHIEVREPLLRYPGIAAVGGARCVVDEYGRRVHRRRVNDRSRIFGYENYALPGEVVTCLLLKYGNIIGEPTGVLWSGEAFRELNGYRTDMVQASDLELLLSAARRWSLGYVGHATYRRVVHGRSATLRNRRDGVERQERSRLIREELARLPSPRPDVAVAVAHYGVFSSAGRDRACWLELLRLTSRHPIVATKWFASWITGVNTERRFVEQYRIADE